MGLWSGLKRFFGGGKSILPENPQGDDLGPVTWRESQVMMDRLLESNTRNEVMLRQIRHEVEGLEKREGVLEDQIRALPPDSFKVRLMLQELDQLHSEKEAKVRRADVYSGNIKRNKVAIQNLEIAMATGERGVTAEEYARIQIDQREQLEAWRAEQVGEVRGEKGQDLIAERDRQRLAELERKVIGTNTHFGAPKQQTKHEPPVTEAELDKIAAEAARATLETEESTTEAPRRVDESESA